MTTCSRVRRVLAAVAILSGTSLWSSGVYGEPSDGEPSGPSSFVGSATAVGVHLVMKVAPAIGTDTPIDGGGPTAAAAVDSLGTSSGYAAFPDPGQAMVVIPGTVAGVVNSGAGGLPKTQIPPPPPYPFFVQSDPSIAPEQSAGSGPYEISASSTPESSKAQARAGFDTGLVGHVALATSRASVAPVRDQVVAEAVSRLEGLSVGPLSIGEVESIARQTLDSSGRLTPHIEMKIVGFQIGGVPVAVTPDGLSAGGKPYPLPINPTLDGVLKSSGISVRIVSAQQLPDRAIAPALEITFPFEMPAAAPSGGRYSGSLTMTIGSGVAQMQGSGSDTADATGGITAGVPPTPSEEVAAGSANPTLPELSFAESGASDAATSGSDLLPGGLGGRAAAYFAPDRSRGSVSGAATPSEVAESPPVRRLTPAVPAGRSVTLIAARRLDVRSFYLVVVGGAIVALLTSQLIRRLGGQI